MSAQAYPSMLDFAMIISRNQEFEKSREALRVIDGCPPLRSHSRPVVGERERFGPCAWMNWSCGGRDEPHQLQSPLQSNVRLRLASLRRSAGRARAKIHAAKLRGSWHFQRKPRKHRRKEYGWRQKQISTFAMVVSSFTEGGHACTSSACGASSTGHVQCAAI